MKVSVIIAAYNAQRYLRGTLESVISQSLRDIEVIIINDGSTDDTLNIATEYSQRFSYIHVVSQENSGPAIARNHGIRLAKGDFLFFLDADDLLTQEALYKLYMRAVRTHADLVIAKYNIINDYTYYPVTNLDNLVKLDVIDKYDTRILWTFTSWNKLFRRSMILRNDITFPPLSYSEDGAFTMNVVMHAKKITGLDEFVLNYRRDYHPDSTSITANVAPWKIDHYIQAHKIIRQEASAAIDSDYGEECLQIPKIRKFIHSYEVKEIQTFINQFYAHYWRMDPECREILVPQLQNMIANATAVTKADLADRNPELHIEEMDFSSEALLRNATISVILYGTPERKEVFKRCLLSILGSNYVSYVIYVPANMRDIIDAWQKNPLLNIFYIEETAAISFYEAALNVSKTEYILFGTDSYRYSFSAFSKMIPLMIEYNYDYCSELIYHLHRRERHPLRPSLAVYQKHISGRRDPSWDSLDAVLPNKLFRRSYLMHLFGPEPTQDDHPWIDKLQRHMQKGYHGFFDHGVITFVGSIEDYLQELTMVPYGLEIEPALLQEITSERLSKIETKIAKRNARQQFFLKLKGGIKKLLGK